MSIISKLQALIEHERNQKAVLTTSEENTLYHKIVFNQSGSMTITSPSGSTTTIERSPQQYGCDVINDAMNRYWDNYVNNAIRLMDGLQTIVYHSERTNDWLL